MMPVRACRVDCSADVSWWVRFYTLFVFTRGIYTLDVLVFLNVNRRY